VITSYALATLNALLNTLAATFVVLGYRAIRDKRVADHRRHMLSAFALSCVFLVSYLTRIYLFGDTHFVGTGAVRYAYFALLISHVVLALLIAPGVLYTVVLGLRGKVEAHRRVAPKVLPVWLYVLVTGVLVYLFLHHYPL
jgi:putative membrane protein